MNTNFKVNLELYKVFYMAAMLGSMTRTAEKLYIGQPAVSKSIKTLEEELAITLFVRGSRGLELTDAGRVLFQHVSEAMEQIHLAEQSLLEMQHKPSEVVRIEICAMQFKLLILPHLKTFFEYCPKSGFDISPTTDTYSSLQRLEEGAIDCCILTKPMDAGGFKFIKLFTFHDYLIGSPEYIEGISRAGKDTIKNMTLISVMNKSIMSSYERMRLKNISPNNKMKVTSMDHTIALAKLGHGVGFIAEELVQEELLSRELVKMEVPLTHHSRDVGFLIGKNMLPSQTLMAFIDYFKKLYHPQQETSFTDSQRETPVAVAFARNG